VVGAIAVGNLSFVEKLKSELGFKAAHPAAMRRFNSSRACPGPDPGFKVQGNTGLLEQEINGTYALRERSEAFGSNFSGKNEALSSENTRFWNENPELPRLSLVRPRPAFLGISRYP